MKIRAIEIEDGGKVTRYTGFFEVESSWDAPERGKYGKPESVVGAIWCRCGHLENEHLPECVYKIEGCECEGYAEGKG